MTETVTQNRPDSIPGPSVAWWRDTRPLDSLEQKGHLHIAFKIYKGFIDRTGLPIGGAVIYRLLDQVILHTNISSFKIYSSTNAVCYSNNSHKRANTHQPGLWQVKLNV